MARALRTASEWGLSLVLPRVCVDCGGISDPARALCGMCRSRIMTETVAPELPFGVLSLRVGAVHQGCVRRMVHGLKYEGRHAVRRDLVDLLLCRGLAAYPPKAVLVPVPVTNARRRERGYNQAEVLARELGVRLPLPVVPDFLVRTRFAGSQTRKSGEERREALAGMFAPGPGFRRDAVPVLVDDVLTTGATLSACAATCLHAGVPDVHAICAAWASEA